MAPTLALALTLAPSPSPHPHPSPSPSPSPKQAQLRQVLVAYSLRNPRVGYVQGMGFVAALLLVFIDEPEEVSRHPSFFFSKG